MHEKNNSLRGELLAAVTGVTLGLGITTPWKKVDPDQEAHNNSLHLTDESFDNGFDSGLHSGIEYEITTLDFPTLQVGETGEWVGFLQESLNNHGYNLAVDSTFGNKTEFAVMIFQGANALPPTGIVDKKTWDLLTPEFSDLTGVKPLASYSTEVNQTKFDLPIPSRDRKMIQDACEVVAPGDTAFRQSMMFVMHWEGGFTIDHAGHTKFGITKNFYDDYLRTAKIDPSQAKEIKDLTIIDAVSIYHHNTWTRNRCNEIATLFQNIPFNQLLNPERSNTAILGTILANGSINYGQGRTYEFLRIALNECNLPFIDPLPVKRSLDTNCIQAIEIATALGQIDRLVNEYLKIEGAHYQTTALNPKFEKFKDGWMNRHESIRDFAGDRNKRGEPRGLLSTTVQMRREYGTSLRVVEELMGIQE